MDYQRFQRMLPILQRLAHWVSYYDMSSSAPMVLRNTRWLRSLRSHSRLQVDNDRKSRTTWNGRCAGLHETGASSRWNVDVIYPFGFSRMGLDHAFYVGTVVSDRRWKDIGLDFKYDQNTRSKTWHHAENCFDNSGTVHVLSRWPSR